MSRLVPRAAAWLLVAAVLTGCGAGRPADVLPSPQPAGPGAATPSELVAQRRAAGIADCPASDLTATGDLAVVLDCLGGDTRVNLAGLPRTRPVIINVWAQWCGPCRDEAPILAELATRLGDKVVFLGLDYADPRPEWAIEFARVHRMTYPELADPERTAQGPLRIAGQPQTLFITTEGTLVVAKVGPWESASEFAAAITRHLAVRP